MQVETVRFYAYGIKLCYFLFLRLLIYLFVLLFHCLCSVFVILFGLVLGVIQAVIYDDIADRITNFSGWNCVWVALRLYDITS